MTWIFKTFFMCRCFF